jgi:hypothetical protein
MTDGLVDVDFKTHIPTEKTMCNEDMYFTIVPDELDKDIVITIQRNQPQTSIITSKFETLNEKSEFLYASQVNIVPDFSKVPEITVSDCTYVIVIDSSGSMIDFNNIEKAKDSAVLFTSSLPIGSLFNLYHFSSTFRKFNDKPEQTTVESKQNAVKWINDIWACGGTVILPVLKDIYTTLKDVNSSIIFISDGYVTNNNEIVNLVRQNRDISINSIGIGPNVSHQLIKDMAKQSSGVAEFINDCADDLELKVLAQLDRSRQKMRKYMKNNKISVNVNGSYTMTPECTVLYEGDVNTFYIFSNQKIESVTYDNDNNDSTTVYPNLQNNEGNLIHRLAGMSLINDLQANDSPIIDSQVPHLRLNLNETNKEKRIKISQTLGILCDDTSFVGVEEQSTPNGIVQVPILRQVPLQTHVHNHYRGIAGSTGTQGSKGSTSIKTALSVSNDTMVKKCMNQSRSIDHDSYDKVLDCASLKKSGSYNKSSRKSTKKSSRYDNTESIAIKKISLFDNFFRIFDAPPTTCTNPKDLPIIVASYTVEQKLPGYIVLGKTLSGKENGQLPFAKDILVNDYILLTLETGNNGVYKVINLGSKDSVWVLKREGI